MAGFNSPVLDAPDTAVRRIMMKREAGQPLTKRETDRLGTRMSAEAQTAREAGTVRQGITPKRVSAFEQGQKARSDDDGFAAGYEGRDNPASPVQRAPQLPQGMSTSEATARMRAGGGVNVNSYRGSMWAQPGSYTEARPADSAAPSSMEKSADSALRRRFGPSPADRGEIDIAGTKGVRTIPGSGATEQGQSQTEASADSILRNKYGAPPNERNTVDVAPSQSPVKRSPAIAAAARPTSSLSGNVRRLSDEEIEAARRRGKYSQPPIQLPPI